MTDRQPNLLRTHRAPIEQAWPINCGGFIAFIPRHRKLKRTSPEHASRAPPRRASDEAGDEPSINSGNFQVPGSWLIESYKWTANLFVSGRTLSTTLMMLHYGAVYEADYKRGISVSAIEMHHDDLRLGKSP